MKTDKRKKLEAAGWRVGDAKDFLELSEAEMTCMETKMKTIEMPGVSPQGTCYSCNKQSLK